MALRDRCESQKIYFGAHLPKTVKKHAKVRRASSRIAVERKMIGGSEYVREIRFVHTQAKSTHKSSCNKICDTAESITMFPIKIIDSSGLLMIFRRVRTRAIKSQLGGTRIEFVYQNHIFMHRLTRSRFTNDRTRAMHLSDSCSPPFRSLFLPESKHA